jgi:hypothetical protein
MYTSLIVEVTLIDVLIEFDMIDLSRSCVHVYYIMQLICSSCS